MFTNLTLPAAWLLLLGTVSAVPRSGKLVARQVADSPAPWVTVDAEGITKTVTPVLTTINGTPTVLSPAPHDATATWTTSTGLDKPAPTHDKAVGGYPACNTTHGEFRPFCQPFHHDVYHPDQTCYVSWDTSFFPSANSTTLKILGFYVFNNTVIPTTGPPSGKEEAFNSGEVPAAWGYWDWKLKRELLETQSLDAVNITLRMVALPRDGSAARWLAGPTVTLQYRPQPPPKPKKNKAPAGEQELYIALPAVFGFAGLMIVGTFFWNRQVRAIGVGNIMGRGRRLRTAGSGGKRREGLAVGMGASKKDRARNKEQAIRLMERDGAGTDSEGDDWDQGWGQDASGRSEEGVEKGPGKGKRVFERLDRKRM